MNKVKLIRSELLSKVSVPSDKAAAFFKTGNGHYAEADQFIGITVPDVRKIAKNFSDLSLVELQSIIESRVNEERLLGLIILVAQYKAATDYGKEEIYRFYVSNLKYVNNWNLVDASAHLIMGAHLWDKDRQSLLALANSPILWERRIAIVATWYFIKEHDLEWTFKIAQVLLCDTQDLIHKATGWMLREAGKKNQTALIEFLNHHATRMPRTMLRYAIEKFPEALRQLYLKRR